MLLNVMQFSFVIVWVLQKRDYCVGEKLVLMLSHLKWQSGDGTEISRGGKDPENKSLAVEAKNQFAQISTLTPSSPSLKTIDTSQFEPSQTSCTYSGWRFVTVFNTVCFLTFSGPFFGRVQQTFAYRIVHISVCISHTGWSNTRWMRLELWKMCALKELFLKILWNTYLNSP